jgi:DNA-binding NtrC family response regulator
MSTTEQIRLPRLPIEQLVRLRWQQALADHQDNRTLAAKELGVSVRTLQRWMRELAAEARATNNALTDVSGSSSTNPVET